MHLRGPTKKVSLLWDKAEKERSLLQAMIPLSNEASVNEKWGTETEVNPFENPLEIEHYEGDKSLIQGNFSTLLEPPNKAFAKYLAKNEDITIVNHYLKGDSPCGGCFKGSDGTYEDVEDKKSRYFKILLRGKSRRRSM